MEALDYHPDTKYEKINKYNEMGTDAFWAQYKDEEEEEKLDE